MPGYGTSPFQTPEQVRAAVGSSAVRASNTAVPSGQTVSAQVETAFVQKLKVVGGSAPSGTRIRLLQWGLYTSMGVTPSIVPRVRLGGVSLHPARTVTGLLASSNNPWQARSDFLVTDQGIVGVTLLTIDDNQVRIFGGAPVTGVNLAIDNDLISSAQWGQAGCAITCQGWCAEVIAPST